MIHIIFNDLDKRWMFFKIDNNDDVKNMRYLREHLNLVDPICYLKTYNGPRFTQDFLFEHTQPTGNKIWYCSIGLWQEVRSFFRQHNIPFDGIDNHPERFKRTLKHSFEEFCDIVDSWNLLYKPRPYQYEAAYNILNWQASVSGLATRAGKTLIAYIIFRYGIEYLGFKRILMIVPSVDLVKQGYNDFKEYAEFFNTECVWGGGKLVESSNLTIGTFQSLIKFLDKKSKKYNPSFYDGYDCVFVDETHRATAAQTKQIITQPFMNEVKLRFGMTGTIPKKCTIEYYCLKSILGATIQEITPKELMDEGYIAPVKINQIRLEYTNAAKAQNAFIRCAEYGLSEFETEEYINKSGQKRKRHIKLPEEEQCFQIQYKKTLPYGLSVLKSNIGHTISKDNYMLRLRDMLTDSTGANLLVIEKMMTHMMTERVDYLLNEVLPMCDKNTILFCHHVQYIEWLTEIIKERFPERHVMIINGSISAKKRDEVKKTMKEHKDCILLASYACMSTGITLSDLCYGIFFESFKSTVVNMQSIGRGLGLSSMRETFILYDIIDDFRSCFKDIKNMNINKLYLQGVVKIKLYKENKYDFEIFNKKI